MQTWFYRIKCLTSLHMGSGESVLSAVDHEVEKDPVLGEPVMNASGVKGALRSWFREQAETDSDAETYIFGSGGKPGHCRFFQADLLARPVRVSSGDSAYVLATTPELISHFCTRAALLGIEGLDASALPKLPADGSVLCSIPCQTVEGLPVTAARTGSPLLELLLGSSSWCLMSPSQLSEIDLPVVTRNVLEDGISRTFWYDQIVPHQSVFGLLLSCPPGDKGLPGALGSRAVVQFGSGASIGWGYTVMEQVVTGNG